jgi:hypothetical protein
MVRNINLKSFSINPGSIKSPCGDRCPRGIGHCNNRGRHECDTYKKYSAAKAEEELARKAAFREKMGYCSVRGTAIDPQVRRIQRRFYR